MENSLDNLGKPTPPAGYGGWSKYSHLGRGGLKRLVNAVISPYLASRWIFPSSAMFGAFLPWVVYTHTTACGRVVADCADLRRTVRESRLRRELPVARTFDLAEGLCVVAALIGGQFTGKPGWPVAGRGPGVFAEPGAQPAKNRARAAVGRAAVGLCAGQRTAGHTRSRA